jgi:hypothetical protein
MIKIKVPEMTEPVFEVNKEISVTGMMQLIDLNGTKVNFQSEFTISTKDPSKKILIAIVNQDQLDNGDIQFEPSEDGGKFSRRITYQQNRHLNHFIALKKIDKEETPVDCTVTVRLRDLGVIKEMKEPEKREREMPIENKERKERERNERERNERNERNDKLNGGMDPNVRDQLSQQLSSLRNNPEYYSKDSYPPPQNIHNIQNENKKKPNPNIPPNRPLTFQEKLKADPYYLVGIITLILFVILLSYKFMRK